MLGIANGTSPELEVMGLTTLGAGSVLAVFVGEPFAPTAHDGCITEGRSRIEVGDNLLDLGRLIAAGDNSREAA